MLRRALVGLVLLGYGGPALATTCPTLVGQWSAGPADAVAAAGSYVYFSSGANFVAADIGNPASPTVIGSLSLPGPATRIALSGDVAYVAMGDAGLVVIDVADPAHPAQVGQLAGPAYDVAASGTNVFVAAGELLVFDASDPTALAQVGSLPRPPSPPAGFRAVSAGGNVVIAMASADVQTLAPGVLDVVLVSDPSHPTTVYEQPLGYLTGAGPWATILGSIALVPTQTAMGFGVTIWNLANPASPVTLGSFGGGLYPHYTTTMDSLVATGTLAFLVESGVGIDAFSFADPAHPVAVGTVSPQARLTSLAVTGFRVVATGGWAGLLVFGASACGLGGCSLICTPTVPASASAEAPIQFQGAYQASGCTGSASYDWSFGDGSPHASEQDPSHTYAAGGSFTWTMAVTLGGASCSRSGLVQIASTEPPIIAPGTYIYVVAASAHTAGLNGTHWITDLTLANPGLADTTARLYFLKGWQDNSGAIAHPVGVPLRQSVALADVVQKVFGEPSATGAVLVGADAPLLVGSRTYNDTPAGSFGQYVPGRPRGEATGFGQTAWLIGLSQSSSTTTGFRTNIGLVNVTAQSLEIELALYRGDGTWLGTRMVSLRPFEFQQLDRTYTLVTDAEVPSGYAVVDTTTQGGRFFAYASVIDNRTGDAINVPAR